MAKSLENAGFFGMQRIIENEEKSQKDGFGHMSSLVFSFWGSFGCTVIPYWVALDVCIAPCCFSIIIFLFLNAQSYIQEHLFALVVMLLIGALHFFL